MIMAKISPSRRLRRTPFSAGVEAQGVSAYTVYNHMLLPAAFKGVEEDYHHLKSQVQVWDVACERQVELTGPDADKLVQLMTPRDLRKMDPDRCYYAPMVDAAGGMLNDPVAMRVDEDRWWLSIADSDVVLWAKGLACGFALDVRVSEADVSPLAVQGPKSDALMRRVFGGDVDDIRFFRYKRLPFMGRNLVVARSGYSKQGGFEIYVEGSELGMPLWHALFEAGKDLDVRPGCPNLIERIEGGLLSYGNDMTAENTPHECGLERFCDLPDDIPHIGKAALSEEKTNGPGRQIRPVAIEGGPVPACCEAWPVTRDGTRVGQVTSAAWSPDFGTTVSIGMIDRAHWAAGTGLTVEAPDGPRAAEVQAGFWV
jgi:dimethylsulfoniopropionate demethylase